MDPKTLRPLKFVKIKITGNAQSKLMAMDLTVGKWSMPFYRKIMRQTHARLLHVQDVQFQVRREREHSFVGE
jgi:hypothetical protein